MDNNSLLEELTELWDISHESGHSEEMAKIALIVSEKFSLDAVIVFNNHIKEGLNA